MALKQQQLGRGRSVSFQCRVQTSKNQQIKSLNGDFNSRKQGSHSPKTNRPPFPITEDPPRQTKLDTKHEILIAHNSKRLSASYLYRNYASNKTEVEAKLAEQIAMRYQTPGTCPEYNLQGITYFFSLDQLLNNSFSKTVRVSTLVFKACSQFLAAVGRKLKVMEHANHRTASLCIEGYRQVTNTTTSTTSTTTNTTITMTMMMISMYGWVCVGLCGC